MSKLNTPSKPQTNWFVKHKVVLLIIVAILILDIFVTGFMKFGYYVVKCGGVPVSVKMQGYTPFQVERSSFYSTPGNYFPGGANTLYFCTSTDAEANGFIKGF